MKVEIRRVADGEMLPRRLAKSGSKPQRAPAEGLLIGYEGDTKVYVRLEDISEVLDGDYEVLSVDSWRDDGDEEAEAVSDER